MNAPWDWPALQEHSAAFSQPEVLSPLTFTSGAAVTRLGEERVPEEEGSVARQEHLRDPNHREVAPIPTVVKVL